MTHNNQGVNIKRGDRVGAIIGSGKNGVLFLGYGVYEGDFEVPREVLELTSVHRAMLASMPADEDLSKMPDSPRIRLDNGDIAWGCECWWGPEPAVKKQMSSYESVENVRIEGCRQNSRAKLAEQARLTVPYFVYGEAGAMSIAQCDYAWWPVAFCLGKAQAAKIIEMAVGKNVELRAEFLEFEDGDLDPDSMRSFDGRNPYDKGIAWKYSTGPPEDVAYSIAEFNEVGGNLWQPPDSHRSDHRWGALE